MIQGPSARTQSGDSPARGLGTQAPREVTVGRGAEREQLADALVQAEQGRPRIVILEGDAGIGKSHLLRELVGIARARGFAVGCGHAIEQDAVPYLILEGALRMLARSSGRAARTDDPIGAARTSHLAPGSDVDLEKLASAGARGGRSDGPLLRGADSVRPEALGLARASHIEWLELVDALVALGRSGPMLLALDDVHWADEASLQVVLRLGFALSDAAAEGGSRFLLALGTRPRDTATPAGRTLLRLYREPIAERLELRGLDLLDTIAILRAGGLLGLAPSTAQAVHEGTGGNPLFLKGLLARAQREATGARGKGLVLDPDLGPLPADLRAVVSAQIGAADPVTLGLLRGAALLGRPFSLTLLSRVAGVSLESLLDALGRFSDLVHLAGDAGEIAHPLIQQELIQGMPPLLRQQRHAEIARVLALAETAPSPGVTFDPLLHAHHVLLAGEHMPEAEALLVLERAAVRLEAMFAFGKAAQFYAAAAALEPAAPKRAELHFRAGCCHHQCYDREASVAQYDAALAVLDRLRDDSGMARVLGARARLDLYAVPLMRLRDLSPLLQVLERLKGQDLPSEGWLHCALADAYFYGRRSEDAERHARRAVALGEHHGDHRLCRSAYLTLGLSQAQAMEYAAAAASQVRAIEHARASGDITVEAAPRVRHALALCALGRLGEARDECEVALRIATETSDAVEHAMALAVLCGIEAACGSFVRAREHAVQMLRWLGRCDARPWIALIGVPAYAYVRHAQGESEDALHALAALTEPDRFMPRVGRAEYAYRITLSDLIAASLGAARDDDAGQLRRSQVERYAADVDPERVDGMGILAVCALAELCVHYQLPAAVAKPRATLERAVARGARLATGWPFLLPRVLGNVESMLGDRARARAYFEEALRVGAAAGAGAELAHAQLDYARALAAEGSAGARRKARDLLLPALDRLTELQMATLLPRAANLAAALGLRTPPAVAPTPVHPHELSLVHQLLSSDAPSAVADRHLLSPSMLRERAGKVFERLGVRGPLELVPYALEQGLIPEPPAQPGVPLALLVSDLSGFTPLVERLGDARAQQIIQEHNALIRTEIRENSGLEVTHTGDGIMAAFRSIPEAVSCAIGIQAAIARRNEIREPRLHLRIGLHAGEPLLEEGRLFGACVIAAVRICGACEPDRILASSAVRSSATEAPFRFIERGRRRLKGLRSPVELYEVAWRDAGPSLAPA
jgi:adenylate cyclase